jgi:hypothetical protein
VRILNELRACFLEVRILKRMADYRELGESVAPNLGPKTFSGGTRFAGTLSVRRYLAVLDSAVLDLALLGGST